MKNEEIYKKIISSMDKEYELVYADQNETVSPEVVKECIDKKEIYPYFEHTDVFMCDSAYESARYILDDIIERLDLSSEDRENFMGSEDYDEAIRNIIDRDSSTASEDIFKQTEMYGRVTLNSNYESISDTEDNFEYGEGYLRTMIDLLNLNPQLVKKAGMKIGYTFVGRWPNLSSRNGKEVIRYEDVFRFIKDCWYSSQLTFVGKINMESLFDRLCKNDLKGIVIPKGTTFIAFSSWEGFGGENEFTTINDLDIDKANRKGLTEYDTLDLHVDEKMKDCNYSVTETFGGPVSEDYLF